MYILKQFSLIQENTVRWSCLFVVCVADTDERTKTRPPVRMYASWQDIYKFHTMRLFQQNIVLCIVSVKLQNMIHSVEGIVRVSVRNA